MRNRKEIRVLLDYCVTQRKILPRISKLGSNNYEELDEQIELLSKVLNTGTIPNMDGYIEDITNSFALWVLGFNTTYDDLVKELIEDVSRS